MTWLDLLKTARTILEKAGIPASEWSFGGGTALALFLQHRESRDIDIFFTDAQYLTLLTPRLNPTTAGMSSDYIEAASFLKLKLNTGEIDFIVAPYLTSPPYFRIELQDEQVNIETPAEIVLKKLFFRTETLKARDIIDTAAVYQERKGELLSQARLLLPRLDILQRRWTKLQQIYYREAQALLITQKELLEKAPALFTAFLHDVHRLS
ncbi:nucleotidyl transferase AbiEii/AbiGii toxin family protein [Desulfurispora thermophila]|uniref:nucleotidyl transferase AbiEii/AbiGii toxin family protein n=1 Tax=Desulfurispora thermophila TaxID=265470 RepID=UPI00037F0DC1|nr:nucleotidyl transferase AbiEii/AbiGii toxin family protein [Desulfurispora thermophila]